MSYPNMSYCKWENTALAMEQCIGYEEELAGGYTDPDVMDDHEVSGMRRCLRAAHKMLQLADPDLLRALDLED